ncbi:hypothetical protein TNCV_1056881 [Trichonephila clavipes]|nr:hypothetical protein TNCV_1056881 [Trichonephila clavipes]
MRNRTLATYPGGKLDQLLGLQASRVRKCPSSTEDEQEREGTGKERIYPLHKSHTTQVTASKAHQGRLMRALELLHYRDRPRFLAAYQW